MDFFKRFAQELQALEESTKRRVLAVSTVVVMAVVIYFWVGYFGTLITAIPQEQGQVAQTVPATAIAQDAQPNFWQNMKTGAAALYNMVRGPKQYDIQPGK